MSFRFQPVADEASLEARLLDAAADVVARQGLRKTSMDDIARRAGCARPTLYKHFPSRQALLGALLLREVDRYLASLEAYQARRPPSTVLEDSFVFTLRYVREHPVAQGLLAFEPEAFVPLLRGAGSGVLEAILDAVAALVREQMRRGVLRRTDPRLAAEAFLRFTASFVLLPAASGSEDERHIRRLFRESLLRGLAPAQAESVGSQPRSLGRSRGHAGGRSSSRRDG